MNDPDAMNQRDLNLLDEIEAVIHDSGAVRQVDDSLYGFCAHLASTLPQAGQAYQQNLEAQLVEAWQHQRSAGKRSSSLPSAGLGHYPAWSKKAAPPALPPVAVAGRAFHRPGRRLVVSLLLILLVVSSLAFISPVRALAGRLIQEIILGDDLRVEKVEFRPGSAEPPAPANRWSIQTEVGSYGGKLPPGSHAAVRTFATLAQARQQAGFSIAVPHTLPEGYALREVSLPPEGVAEQAYLIYAGPGRDIVVIQGPLGELPAGISSQVTVIASAIVTTGALAETQVGDHPAAWIDGKLLAWEADGVGFQVGGLDLSLAEALQIAVSMGEP